MSRTTDILNLFAAHGVLVDECDVEEIRQRVRQCPNHVIIENDDCALWAFPVNSYEVFEGTSEFMRDAHAQPDAWFIWLAIGRIEQFFAAMPFALSKVIFYRANKSGDRTIREYSLARIFNLHMKHEYTSELPVALNLGGGDGGTPFGDLLAKRFKNESKLDKLGVLKPMQQQILQDNPERKIAQSQQNDQNTQQPVMNDQADQNAGNKQRAAYLQFMRVNSSNKKSKLG